MRYMYFFILVLLLACNNNNLELSGIWYEHGKVTSLNGGIQVEERQITSRPYKGFYFLSKDSMEILWLHSSWYAQYEIKEDNLIFWVKNNKTSTFDTLVFEFRYLNKDSILLKSETDEKYTLYKTYNIPPSNYQLDSIVLIQNNSWGIEQKYRINADDSFEWKYLKYNADSIIHGQLPPSTFDTLSKKYNLADFYNVEEDDFYGNDSFVIIILFYKNGEILKEIEYNDYNAPFSLLWAYIYHRNIIHKELKNDIFMPVLGP